MNKEVVYKESPLVGLSWSTTLCAEMMCLEIKCLWIFRYFQYDGRTFQGCIRKVPDWRTGEYITWFWVMEYEDDTRGDVKKFWRLGFDMPQTVEELNVQIIGWVVRNLIAGEE